MRKCEIENCGGKHRAKGLCSKHYSRLIALSPTKRKCSVEKCDNRSTHKGMCNKHYRRFIRTGLTEIFQRQRHGLSLSAEYSVWMNMNQRCNNEKTSGYKNYGGRGIKVCKEWENSFLCFFNDMGRKPEGKDIDRIDNEKGYSKDNCRWVNRDENNQNRRSTKLTKDDVLKIRSSSLSKRELASIYKVRVKNISRVINREIWKNV